METAEIAKVAVAAVPYSIDKPYDYLIPDWLLNIATVGIRVIIPFGRGNRTSEGVILARSTALKTEQLKTIITILDSKPVLNQQEIALALWMRQRYFCTMYNAIKAILPAGLWYRFRELYYLGEGLDKPSAYEMASSIKGAAAVLDVLFAWKGSVSLETFQESCGENAKTTLKKLCKIGVMVHKTQAHQQVCDKTRRMVELAVPPEEAMALVTPKRKSAPMRYEAVRLLTDVGKASSSDISYFTGASLRTLRSLEKSGIVTFSEEEQLRLPPKKHITPGTPIILNDEQQAAFSHIFQMIEKHKPAVSLLHGVTGSGKTEVYLRLVQETLKLGRTAIVLVPEIVLTPQMMERFSSYFDESVVMIHSGLRVTERYDQWKRIKRGEIQVVLGTRSAIFAPLLNIGLIVMDEEQESSYQSESPPRYHAREVAKFRCTQDNATLLLGSATPSIESRYSAEKGTYQYDRLEHRYNENALPDVEIADLREEIRSGNNGTIGHTLFVALQENIKRGEQSILFLNRRGNSRMLICGECGYVPECPRCSVALTYHSANERLMCHYCGHSEKSMEICPTCGGLMKYIGIGTQKVEAELHELFPDTAVLRMDADTTSGGPEKILQTFRRDHVPILLGTQMVTKGLDFESVTLVGVLAADLSLYVDHYRAAERTFSLLTQVVGRAGRGCRPGRAVIQTYTPENDVITSAAQQDYNRFYKSEIHIRTLRRYPPIADLFTFTVTGLDEGTVLRASSELRDGLRLLFTQPEVGEIEVLGPAPAPVMKVNRRYRYRVLLIGTNNKPTRDRIDWILKEFTRHRNNRKLNIFVCCNAME